MKLNCVIAGVALSLAAASVSAATVEEAEAAFIAAQKTGFSWTTTDSWLKKAKKAQENNDAPNLEIFIAAVMKESAASLNQAELAKKAAPRF